MRKLLAPEGMSRRMPYDPVMAAPDSPLAAALERVGDRWSLLLVEARWYCPTCDRPVEGKEAEQVRRV